MTLLKNQNDMELKDFKSFNLRTLVSIPIIAVYENPADYPGKHVARLWDIKNKPTRFVVVRNSLEEIRMAIPSYMTRLGACSMDDPVIVETWI